MAFTLKIKQKKLIKSKPLAINQLAAACGLNFGGFDDFYVLHEEGEHKDTAVLYNPQRIGRGIYLDVRQGAQGEYELSYNIPTTPAEIADFARLAAEIEQRLGGEQRVETFCPEEERCYTARELVESQPAFEDFSLQTLRRFCSDEQYGKLWLTVALWPYCVPEELRERWRQAADLGELEQVLHELQSRWPYYAKPRLLQKDTGEIGAFYVLTEECESVFPEEPGEFLNFSDIKIAEGFVQFFIYSENRVLEGLYPYAGFIREVRRREWCCDFDGCHLLIRPLTKAEILEIVEAIK